jgi:hypothetical protein
MPPKVDHVIALSPGVSPELQKATDAACADARCLWGRSALRGLKGSLCVLWPGSIGDAHPLPESISGTVQAQIPTGLLEASFTATRRGGDWAIKFY